MTIMITTKAQWVDVQKKLHGKTLGLVPTMGNLHPGHLSLVAQSMRQNDVTVLYSFVNPTQFNNKDDFDHYPRTMEDDLAMCRQMGVDYFFAPSYETMYPDDYRYQVSEKQLSLSMEGKHRPGHFDGMLTIVLKFLLLMKPNHIYFGEKDFQQLQLVRGLVEAFFIDTTVVACPTIRESSGLAMSSRNGRLSPEHYELSPILYKTLSSNISCGAVSESLQKQGFEVEYVEEFEGRRYAAVKLGDVRLIDNVEVIS